MSSSLFRKEAVEHQKDHLMGDVLLLQPLSLAILTGVSVVIAGLILILLFWGSYARKETVHGYLTPDRGIVKIYPPNTGTISKVHVKEGQQVKEGQVLFTLLAERSMESGQDIDTLLLQEIARDEIEAHHRISSEQSLGLSEERRLKNQIQGLQEELTRSAKEINLQHQRVTMSEKRVAGVKKLLDNKHMSINDFDKVYEEHLTLLQHQEEMMRHQRSKQNALDEAKSQLEQLPLQIRARISDIEKGLSDLRQRKFEVEGRRAFEIRAPIQGTVDALQVNTGQFLNNMQAIQLMAIIPDNSELLAELYVPTRAVGFVEVGQEVKLRFDAFPYQRYGTYTGRIVSTSHHILHPSELPIPHEMQEPVYRVVVQLDKQSIHAYGQNVPLQAGMSIEADIILDKQTLVQWILDPLYSLKGRI